MKSLIIGCLLASLIGAPARSWTSSDGEKTFEGELRSYDADTGQVIVLVNGKAVNFNQDKLSETDRTFLTGWKAESEAPDPAEILASQKVGKVMTDRVLSRLNGKRFKKATMEKTPEYYLLYFSASW